jgi:glutamine synthetase
MEVRMTPQQVLGTIRDESIQFVDLKFCDLLGAWKHLTVPARQLTEAAFRDGFGFDASSIHGWREIHESDMLMVPDPTTAWVDPFHAAPTLSLICSICEPLTHVGYTRDPRSVAQRAEAYLRAGGLADEALIGLEPEFFIFDGVRFDYQPHRSLHELDSVEGAWATGREESPNLGYKIAYKEGYFPVAPTDRLADLRGEMVSTMTALGLEIEAHHHEVATAGQMEIDMKYGPLLRAADQLMAYRYVARNVAARHGRCVTFMPKPLFGDNGSGMHVHVSLWRGEQALFAGDRYAGLSELAVHFIGGLLRHAPALLALAAPGTNSYRRLVPGYEAPVNLAYSQRNRSAAVRIPMYSNSPKARRIEFRPPDPSCNPYLTFAAILLAGLDGVNQRIDPGPPMDVNIYELTPADLARVPHVPASLSEALDALERDHAFLLQGGVFDADLIAAYVEFKRRREVDAVRMRPHPYEFALYFDR